MKDIRFALLVEGWLHGELDEASSRRLLALVQEDPQRRAFLADQAGLHTMLAAHHADPADGDALLRRVRSGLHGSGRWGSAWGRLAWSAAGLTAATILVAVGLWVAMGSRAPEDAVILWRDGQAMALPDAASWRSGDELRARTTGTVSLPDGSQVTLAADSRLAWHGENTAVALELRAGEAAFAVQPRSQPDFRVATDHLACEVIGTRFTLRTVPSATRLNVQEGRVQVLAGGILAAGEGRCFFADAIVDAWLARLPRRPEALAQLPAHTRPLSDITEPWRAEGTLEVTRDGMKTVLATEGAEGAVLPLPRGLDGDFVIRVTTTVLDDTAPQPSLRLSVHGLSFRVREQTEVPRIGDTTTQEMRFVARGRHHLVDWWEYEQRIHGEVALRGFAYGKPEAIALHLDQIAVRIEAMEVETVGR